MLQDLVESGSGAVEAGPVADGCTRCVAAHDLGDDERGFAGLHLSALLDAHVGAAGAVAEPDLAEHDRVLDAHRSAFALTSTFRASAQSSGARRVTGVQRPPG